MKKIEKLQLRDMMLYPVGMNITYNLPMINCMGDSIIEEYKDSEIKMVNLFCRGSSGAIISAIVSSKLIEEDFLCKIIYIKKEGETSHSTSMNPIMGAINIIIDDFICSGETVNDIYHSFRDMLFGDELDMLIVSSYANTRKLDFSPKTIICGRFN